MKLLICTQVVDKNHPILGFFHNWVLEFAGHFDEVHVICLEKGEYEFPPHVFVYSLGKDEGVSKFTYLYRFYRHFAHIFFRVRVQFVFFHMGVAYNNLAVPFFLLRRLFGTKFYWWKTHGTLTPFGRLALLCVDAVYTASKYSFPLETPKKRVVGHAIDIDAKVPDFHLEKVTPPILLFVGRISPVKRVEIVIETAELLYKKGIPCQVRIVGVMHDSEYAKKLNVKIESSQIAHLITIVGPRKYDELSLEYQNATVLLNPSETGGIDKVVLEAMKFGVPPLALRATYGELLEPFGLAIEKQDVFLYAETAQKLLQDASLRVGLQTRLHNEVVLHHALSTLSRRIFNI
jgi:glycosyltransferase involved in cell wall biosynthesis